MRDVGWHWRNCRGIGLSLEFWPLAWGFGYRAETDVYGGQWEIGFGPIAIRLHANIGNCSSENRFEAWLGLSEAEAYERALRYEGQPQ